jgi:hypothetical protein
VACRGGWRGFLAERDEKSKGAGGGPDRSSVIDLSPERAKQRKEVGSFSGSAVREGELTAHPRFTGRPAGERANVLARARWGAY